MGILINHIAAALPAPTLGIVLESFGLLIAFIVGLFLAIIAFYKRGLRLVPQGTAIVVTGKKGVHVSTSGKFVWPIINRVEYIDISVKRIEIKRHGAEGLVCKDNMRADVEVAFWVRVNNLEADIKKVAQSIGCARASDHKALFELFDAKFSEALKTVGKQFDFTELYTSREQFKEEILKVIGTDLNGYVLDDAAIDYLEQTSLDAMNPNNILDAEGMKKITDLTARQHVLSNSITREKEKTIRRQDVEAVEAILELDRQQAEAEEKQKREVLTYKAREGAEAEKIRQEELLKSERARIATEEEVAVATQNKDRQVVVASKNKERTEKIETERVEKDRMLEATERERVVELATIEKDKAVEVEKRHIQDVIRERVMVERTVAEEEEKIKDTRQLAEANRLKDVQVITAGANAEEKKIEEIKKAEASKVAAEFEAQEVLIHAEAKRSAAEKEASAKKQLAEARTAEEAATGLAEAQVQEAKASSLLKYGSSEADVLRKKAEAEAAGREAKAIAVEKEGAAEAGVMQKKYEAEADGIRQKAESMKVLDGVGRDHEEFKLRLEKDKAVELESIRIHAAIAEHQAKVLAEALKTAKIDIVGGEAQFFDRIVNAITDSKRIDRLVGGSQVLSNVNRQVFGDSDGQDPGELRERVQRLMNRVGIDSIDDVKNLSIAALIGKLIADSDDDGLVSELKEMLGLAKSAGIADEKVSKLNLPSKVSRKR